MRALYVLVVLLQVALVWWLPVFPTQDGPTHIYSTLVLRDLLAGGALYGPFFDLRLSFVPNLGATVPLYALLGVLPPVAAEKAFITLFIVMVAGVMPRLARMAGGEPYPASFLVFPLFGAGLTVYGFYSLMMGQALWLWSVWLFWRVADRPMPLRWAVTTACALVLFAAHFMAFGCFVLAVLCLLFASRPSASSWKAVGGQAVVFLSVPAALTLWYLNTLLAAAGTVVVRGRAPLRWWSGVDPQQDIRALVDLIMWNQVYLSTYQVVNGCMLLGLTAALLHHRRNRPAWSNTGSRPAGITEEALSARRGLGLLAVLLAVLMLAVPDGVGELSLIKSRFPGLVALLLPPILACASYRTSLRRVVLAGALVPTAINAALLHRDAAPLRAFTFDAPVPEVRGQFVAGYRPHPPAVPADTLGHAASYYCAMLGCLDAGNYQAHSRQFFVRFKPSGALRAWPILVDTPTVVAWDRFPVEVTYIVGWDLRPAERARVADHFSLVRESGAVTVWRRRPRDGSQASASP